MMNKEPKTIEDEIGETPVEALKEFLRLWDSPERSGFILGQNAGPLAASLLKKGFILKFGTVGSKQRWICNTEKISNLVHIPFIREITNTKYE